VKQRSMPPGQPTEQPSAAEATFNRMVTPRARVHAIVDAAQNADAPVQARKLGLDSASLFAGALGRDLAQVAPHLVTTSGGAAFGRWWFGHWRTNLGVLFEASASPRELREHFRTLLIVNGDAGRRFYFRFYDPRVMRSFLPHCKGDEVRRFFGPVRAFYCEGAGGTELIRFAPDADGVAITTRPVETS